MRRSSPGANSGSAVVTSWVDRARARSLGSCSSNRTRTRRQRLMRFFQRRHRLLATHRWKIIEELFEAVAIFKVVDQVPQWDTSPDETRCAAYDFGVAVNNR